MQNAVSSEVERKVKPVNIFYTIYNSFCRHVKISHLLIFLFTYTAVDKLNLFSFTPPFSWENFKLVNVDAFTGAMAKSPALRPYVHILAYLIPASELVACFLLLFSKTKKWGYWLSLVLLTSFTGYIIYIIAAYSQELPCTCGGVISQMSWSQHLLFNLFFILLSVKAILSYKRSR